MAIIDEYLSNIQSATYGEEVRQSIHDAIEAINDEAGTLAQERVDLAVESALSEVDAELSNLKSAFANINTHSGGDIFALMKPVIINKQGINYVRNTDGSYTVSGTATGSSYCSIYHDNTAVPAGIVANKTYNLTYTSTNVYFRIYKYYGDSTTLLLDTKTSKQIKFTESDLSDGMIIRLFIINGTTVNETVKPVMYSGLSSNELEEHTDTVLKTGKYPYNALSSAYDTFGNYGLNGSVPVDISKMSGFAANAYRLITLQPFTFDSDTVIRSASGYKFRLIEVVNNVATTDPGGWNTSVTAQAGKSYLLLGAKNNTDTAISLSDKYNFYADILGQKVYSNETAIQGLDNSALKYSIENYLIADNPMLKYYNQFQHKTIDTSTTTFFFTTAEPARMNAILNLEKPLHITMINPEYVMRIYWYDGDTLCSTAWSSHIDVPAGQVALITKAVTGRDISTENPQYYILPNSRYNTPKDYYADEIANTIAKVEKYNTERGLCYLLSTDQHTMTVQGTVQKFDTVTDMAVNMREIAKHITFDANVALGDLTDFKWNNTTNLFTQYGLINTTADEADAIFKAWLDYGMEQLISILPNMYYIMGNHDDNRYINKDRLQETVSRYDHTPGEIHSYYMSHTMRNRVSDTNLGGVNYYVDQDNYKIRILCLDSNIYYGDTPNPVTGYTGWWYGFNDETVTFAQSALNSLPSGYSVLVFCHQSSIKDHNGDNAAYTNFANMQSVFQTFVNGGGKLIAWLYGHQHADWQTADPWLEICFNCQKAQQNNVSTFPTVMQDAVSPARTAGTATEDSWNVLMIKPNNKVISQIRFGAGTDRHFHYEYEAVSGTKTLTSMLSGTLTWGSKNTSVATVSNGTVTSVASGRTLIYATDTNGDTEYWCVEV